ncbi:hypothetical protein CKA32_004772 [Geitlerinema sp. FC II]|nr:hypothetical protein CKA32_004772 [Geitlerinema sp. FC II]
MLNLRSHPSRLVLLLSITVSVVLFACSNFRHTMFRSTAMDLGFFDQAVYLISRGEFPAVSFWGEHFLGNHAEYSLYLLAPLYKIYPDARWLLAVQAISLALGGWFVWRLARQQKIEVKSAITLAIAYWLYPLVFNVNLFDFHPEVMAIPAILAAVELAKKGRSLFGFTLCILFALGTKAVMSLTVAAMGIWLWGFEKRRKAGAIALFGGLAWFFLATQVVIPIFRPEGVEAVYRYAYLGSSVREILLNLVLKPQLFLGQVFSWQSLSYLLMVAFPVAWGLSLRHLAPLLGAFPILAINILADHPLQTTLRHQYALPILPFLFLAVIQTIAQRQILRRKVVLAWSLAAVLVLGNPNKLIRGFEVFDTWTATREAIARVSPEAKVLTDNFLAPHLTHRKTLLLIGHPSPNAIDLETPDTIVLNLRHPWIPTAEVVRNLAIYFRDRPEFETVYFRNDVVVFQRFSGD